MAGLGSILWAASGFEDYLKFNIEHFQAGENHSYSLALNLYDDSLSNHLSQTEYMHVYTNKRKQCVYTSDRVMIKEGNKLVSILTDEQSVVLQESAESFRSDYVEQLRMLLSAWETLEIESDVSGGSEVTFKITMPASSDYSAIKLSFNKRTNLLTKSTIWLRGEYAMGGKTYMAPRIEMNLSRLMKPQIARLSIQDVLTSDLKLTEQYKNYAFYNTIKK